MDKNILDNELTTLGLSNRTYNAIAIKLRNQNKKYTVRNLLSFSYKELMGIRNLG